MNGYMIRDGFLLNFFWQIYSYREYLVQSVMRDLRNKYKRSVLGYVWTMLHPLGMMAVLAIVFSRILKMPTHDYAVFLFSGLLPWNYFHSTSMMSLSSIRNNARLLGQVPVPKYLFILSVTFSNLVNLFLAIVPLLLIMLFTSREIHWTVLAVPVMLLPIYFITVGISLILATSSVFFDDTLHLSEVALQALYFMSPILYSRDLLNSPVLVSVLQWNPMFTQIEMFRSLFYDGVLPEASVFGSGLAVSLLVLIVGLFIFKRSENKFLYFV